MIAIIGASCSGKTSIERKLTEQGLNRIISYTSRPIRKNEINNIDYHFITEEKFAHRLSNKFFAESTIYNSWKYGIAKEDCIDTGIAVVEFFGLLQLKRNKDLHITSFFYRCRRKRKSYSNDETR